MKNHIVWTHLDLATIADEDMDVPIGDGRVHHRKKGDLLHPEREPQSVLDEMRTAMGTATFSAQYLQKPVPTGGNLVKWEWFRRWMTLPDKKEARAQIVQSWARPQKSGDSMTIRSVSPPW